MYRQQSQFKYYTEDWKITSNRNLYSLPKRYKFYTRDQKQDESVSEYIAELRKLSLYCEFKAFLDDALRDKFVCGLKKSNIRRRLLTEKALTLQNAVEIAKNLDQAEFEKELITTEGRVRKVLHWDICPSWTKTVVEKDVIDAIPNII